ncbi:helix-turn-helix domain-containing protein [Mesorhizobium captivum]|uniref:helix-turn-helix domain-containing protein n=1 Tax=Mesorhizobium captivum TaxID=3072319 RepID=UPI002A246906|nr:helix-turn-helix domain-containing protein [Mesorhizobium sp. VK3C]MDX8445332.1 helix-turn-helix domain-containing protein [Mesorhizobium sp. VK3C]
MTEGNATIADINALLALRRDNRVSYSIREVAEMTGLSERTVLRRIADGTLHAVRAGARTLIVKPQSQPEKAA